MKKVLSPGQIIVYSTSCYIISKLKKHKMI